MSPESRNTLDPVPLGLLRRYLISHGWRMSDGSGPRVLDIAASTSFQDAKFFQTRSSGRRNADIFILSESGLDDIELVIPKDTKGADFDRRVLDAITTLSQLEDRDPSQIVASIRSIGFDVVRHAFPTNWSSRTRFIWRAHRIISSG
jgi:hypothetical protein